jgi:hypothetical protein
MWQNFRSTPMVISFFRVGSAREIGFALPNSLFDGREIGFVLPNSRFDRRGRFVVSATHGLGNGFALPNYLIGGLWPHGR